MPGNTRRSLHAVKSAALHIPHPLSNIYSYTVFMH